MALPDVLGSKPEANYRMVRVACQDGFFTAHLEGTTLNFEDITLARNEGIDSLEMEKNLLSSRGHLLANVGVSALITTTLHEKTYLLAVRQDRRGGVLGLISGYWSHTRFHEPEEQMLEELGEELLPTTFDGKLANGQIGGLLLPRPYLKSVEYSDKISYNLRNSRISVLPDLTDMPFYFNEKVVNAYPYFCSNTNSGQLVFSYHLEFPEEAISRLNHADDEYNPLTGMLDARLKNEGVLLVQLNDKGITDRILQYGVGPIAGDTKDILLSESFAPKKGRLIVDRANIPIEEYITRLQEFPHPDK